MNNLIHDLSDPRALPDRTRRVSVIQTHISVVFVADHFVYKVKKPVNFGFLDFSTLEKREFYCHQEVLLNSRLSRDLYLDVIPVYHDGKRYTFIGEQGDIVEYAVRMKRLSEEDLMIHVFQHKGLTSKHLKDIAGVLARFHADAERSPEIERFGTPESFKVNTDENFIQVEKYRGVTIEKEAFAALEKWTNAFYDRYDRLFLKRIADGRIRDCHGDLHMEHICLTPGIPIFDCIEFNERFRYSDTLADMAFLLMDLEYHGGGREAERLWGFYRAAAEEDEGVASLLTFYKVYRAFVRGKVNSFRLDDSSVGSEERENAIETARRYFELAYAYIAQ
jgi:aminoglycoside phosphotransferase family enzyme